MYHFDVISKIMSVLFILKVPKKVYRMCFMCLVPLGLPFFVLGVKIKSVPSQSLSEEWALLGKTLKTRLSRTKMYMITQSLHNPMDRCSRPGYLLDPVCL